MKSEINYLEVLKVSVPGLDREQPYKVFVDAMHRNSGEITLATLFDLAKTRFGRNPYHIIEEREAMIKASRVRTDTKPNCEMFPIREGTIRLFEKVEGIYSPKYRTRDEADFADRINPEMDGGEVFGVSFVNNVSGATSPMVSLNNMAFAESHSRENPIITSPAMTTQQLLDLLETTEGAIK